jgi:SAM-dependent methyltransferase
MLRASTRYKEIINNRYEDWFNTFLNHTNEKKQIPEILEKVIGVILAHSAIGKDRSFCKILDIGVGEGTLARGIVEALRGQYDLSYNGIEKRKNYVGSVNNALHGLNIGFVNIVEGDFTNPEDLQKLPDDADVILASHVAYYAKNITKFVDDLVGKSKSTTSLIFIHQTVHSLAIELRNKYQLDRAEASPQRELKEALKAHDLEVVELYYPAAITFPNAIAISDLVNNLLPRELLSKQDLIVRDLLEFLFHAPLEYLQALRELKNEGRRLEELLENQKNNFIIWDVFQIATSNRFDGMEAPLSPMLKQGTQDTIDFTKLNMGSSKHTMARVEDFASINLWTLHPLELACYTGNVDIVEQLKPQLSKIIPFNGLIVASRNGHRKVVEELLETKELSSFLNIKSEDGYTALHLAALFDHVYIVELLVFAGVDISIEDNDGHTAFYLSLKKCNLEAAEILWNHTNVNELGPKKLLSLHKTTYRACKTKDLEANPMLDILDKKLGMIQRDCELKMRNLFSGLKNVPKDEVLQQLTLISDGKDCGGIINAEEFVEHYTPLEERYELPQITIPLALDSHFIDKHTNSVLKRLELNKGVVLGGVIGVGKTALSVAVAHKWVEKKNRAVWWFDLDCEEEFHQQIEALCAVLGIEITGADVGLRFSSRIIPQILQGLRKFKQEVLLVFDNYLEFKLDEMIRGAASLELKKCTYIDNRKISGIPTSISMFKAKHLLDNLGAIDKVKIIISTRSAEIPYENKAGLGLSRIALSEFSMQDIRSYLTSYGIVLSDKHFPTLDPLPLRLAYLAKYLKGYSDETIKNVIDPAKEAYCETVPTMELKPVMTAVNEEERQFLLYTSLLGGDIPFIIFDKSIKAARLQDSLSLVEVKSKGYYVPMYVGTLLRDYFWCSDREKLYSAIKAIGNRFAELLQNNAVAILHEEDTYIATKVSASKFCTYANEYLSRDYQFETVDNKLWSCKSDPYILFLQTLLYYDGKEVKRNYEKACETAKKAVELGLDEKVHQFCIPPFQEETYISGENSQASKDEL